MDEHHKQEEWGKIADTRKIMGRYGEKLALTQYEKAGFQCLAQNFSCRFGEIDLILKKGDVYYFVEVRTKTGSRYGFAEESITPQKQKTIRKVSQFYLQKRKQETYGVQYDVVAVFIDKKKKKAWLKRYAQAF